MIIKRERLDVCLLDVDRLLLDYFERTNAQDGQPKLLMDWASMIKLESMGKVALFTARIENKLVGFALYVMYPHLHHGGNIWAMCDILAVDPDQRGKGVATNIVEHAERRFKQMGITQMMHSYRTIYGVTPLFEKLGFTCIEHLYRKAL